MELDFFKECTKCREVKHASQFYKVARNKSGLRSDCKACQAKFAADNLGRIVAGKRARRAAKREMIAALPDEERKKIVEKNRTEEAARRQTRRGRLSEVNRIYRAENVEKLRSIRKARKQQIIRATPSWADKKSIDDFHVIALMFRIYTGQPYHVDHIVPLRGK